MRLKTLFGSASRNDLWTPLLLIFFWLPILYPMVEKMFLLLLTNFWLIYDIFYVWSEKNEEGGTESTATYGPPPPQIFLAPNTFPVIKNGTIKGGAGGLPLQRKPKSNKGVQGVSPCKKDITCKKEGGGCRGSPPAKKKKKKFSSFSSCNDRIRFILADI